MSTYVSQAVAAASSIGDHRPYEIAFTCGERSLGNLLEHLNPASTYTIRIYGACRENLSITGFTRLTLLAAAGASFTDASGGTDYVIQVLKASNVDIEGF